MYSMINLCKTRYSNIQKINGLFEYIGLWTSILDQPHDNYKSRNRPTIIVGYFHSFYCTFYCVNNKSSYLCHKRILKDLMLSCNDILEGFVLVYHILEESFIIAFSFFIFSETFQFILITLRNIKYLQPTLRGVNDFYQNANKIFQTGYEEDQENLIYVLSRHCKISSEQLTIYIAQDYVSQLVSRNGQQLGLHTLPNR